MNYLDFIVLLLIVFSVMFISFICNFSPISNQDIENLEKESCELDLKIRKMKFIRESFLNFCNITFYELKYGDENKNHEKAR